jgi:hypothetical protein
MKKCTKCEIEKEEEEFSKKTKTQKQSACKECVRKNSKKHYEQNKKYYYDRAAGRKQKIKEYIRGIKKISKCVNCGESEDCCLDFHHKNESEKEFELGKAHSEGYSFKKIDVEIKKCAIVCSNCHRKIHAGKLKLHNREI